MLSRGRIDRAILVRSTGGMKLLDEWENVRLAEPIPNSPRRRGLANGGRRVGGSGGLLVMPAFIPLKAFEHLYAKGIQALAGLERLDRHLFVQILSDAEHELSGILASCGFRGKRVAVFFMDPDPLINDLAQLFVDLCLLRAVDSPDHEPGACAHVALVFFGPLNDFQVLIAFLHDPASSIAF